MNTHAFVSHRLFVAALGHDARRPLVDPRLKRALVIGSVVIETDQNGYAGGGARPKLLADTISSGPWPTPR
jgi:hypothetical protein